MINDRYNFAFQPNLTLLSITDIFCCNSCFFDPRSCLSNSSCFLELSCSFSVIISLSFKADNVSMRCFPPQLPSNLIFHHFSFQYPGESSNILFSFHQESMQQAVFEEEVYPSSEGSDLRSRRFSGMLQ